MVNGMTRTLAILTLAVALSGCATIQQVASSRETFVACQVLDTVTTIAAVSRGAVELNPIMAALLKRGYIPFIAAKFAAVWVVYQVTMTPNMMTVVNVISCAPGIHNATLLMGQ
jgi:uncharacterized protein YceK